NYRCAVEIERTGDGRYHRPMAIIRCPDCGSDVPEAASACLGCGRSMQLAALQMETRSTAYQMLFGTVFCLTGVVLVVLGILNENKRELALGAVLALTGSIALVSGRMRR